MAKSERENPIVKFRKKSIFYAYMSAIDVEIGEADADGAGKMRMNFLHANFEDLLVLQRFGAEDEAVGKCIGGARGGHVI